MGVKADRGRAARTAPAFPVVGIGASAGGLVLEIRDDGKRPSGARARGRTPAVRLMRLRADLLGAALAVRPARGRGMSVVCVLPGEGGRRG